MILETLAFDLAVDSPFDHAMHLLEINLFSHDFYLRDVAKRLSGTVEAARQSIICVTWAALRDSWQTEVTIRYSPYDIGCAFAFMAYLLINEKVRSPYPCDWETWTSRPMDLLYGKSTSIC